MKENAIVGWKARDVEEEKCVMEITCWDCKHCDVLIKEKKSVINKLNKKHVSKIIKMFFYSKFFYCNKKWVSYVTFYIVFKIS